MRPVTTTVVIFIAMKNKATLLRILILNKHKKIQQTEKSTVLLRIFCLSPPLLEDSLFFKVSQGRKILFFSGAREKC